MAGKRFSADVRYRAFRCTQDRRLDYTFGDSFGPFFSVSLVSEVCHMYLQAPLVSVVWRLQQLQVCHAACFLGDFHSCFMQPVVL